MGEFALSSGEGGGAVGSWGGRVLRVGFGWWGWGCGLAVGGGGGEGGRGVVGGDVAEGGVELGC